MNENPNRPPKQWMRDCVRGASKSARNPGAVCGALWYHKMSPAQRRAALRREGKDVNENPEGKGRLYVVVTQWTDREGATFTRQHERRAQSRERALALEKDHNKKRLNEGMREEGWSYKVTHVIPRGPMAVGPRFAENPTGGQVAAWVAGAAVLGGVLYLLFRPKTAQAAQATACEPAASQHLYDVLGKFAVAKGYTIFYDEKTTDLATKGPPTNPKFIAAGASAREWDTKLCGFYKWTGKAWVKDDVTNTELATWTAGLPPPSPTATAKSPTPIPGYAHGDPASMFLP